MNSSGSVLVDKISLGNMWGAVSAAMQTLNPLAYEGAEESDNDASEGEGKQRDSNNIERLGLGGIYGSASVRKPQNGKHEPTIVDNSLNNVKPPESDSDESSGSDSDEDSDTSDTEDSEEEEEEEEEEEDVASKRQKQQQLFRKMMSVNVITAIQSISKDESIDILSLYMTHVSLAAERLLHLTVTELPDCIIPEKKHTPHVVLNMPLYIKLLREIPLTGGKELPIQLAPYIKEALAEKLKNSHNLTLDSKIFKLMAHSLRVSVKKVETDFPGTLELSLSSSNNPCWKRCISEKTNLPRLNRVDHQDESGRRIFAPVIFKRSCFPDGTIYNPFDVKDNSSFKFHLSNHWSHYMRECTNTLDPEFIYKSNYTDGDEEYIKIKKNIVSRIMMANLEEILFQNIHCEWLLMDDLKAAMRSLRTMGDLDYYMFKKNEWRALANMYKCILRPVDVMDYSLRIRPYAHDSWESFFMDRDSYMMNLWNRWKEDRNKHMIKEQLSLQLENKRIQEQGAVSIDLSTYNHSSERSLEPQINLLTEEVIELESKNEIESIQVTINIKLMVSFVLTELSCIIQK